jgi:hypothetical protein
VRVRRDALPRVTSFWKPVTLETDEETSTLRIAFPSREIAIAHLLVMGDASSVVSPPDLTAAIVACAAAALERLAPARA